MLLVLVHLHVIDIVILILVSSLKFMSILPMAVHIDIFLIFVWYVKRYGARGACQELFWIGVAEFPAEVYKMG